MPIRAAGGRTAVTGARALRVMHGKRSSSTLLALTAVVFLSACTSSPRYTVRKLRSGREVKVLRITPIRFGNGSSALMLNYQTDLDISNLPALRASELSQAT